MTCGLDNLPGWQDLIIPVISDDLRSRRPTRFLGLFTAYVLVMACGLVGRAYIFTAYVIRANNDLWSTVYNLY